MYVMYVIDSSPSLAHSFCVDKIANLRCRTRDTLTRRWLYRPCIDFVSEINLALFRIIFWQTFRPKCAQLEADSVCQCHLDIITYKQIEHNRVSMFASLSRTW